MKTRGAVLYQVPGKFEIVELDLEEPRQGEIMVKMAASGLCHSDHSMSTGTMAVDKMPMCCGHEGAGVVVQVGPNTSEFSEGDHVVLSCLPSCGKCRMCQTGQGNLCDLSASLMMGSRFDDPTSFRMSLDGQSVGQWCGVSTFSEYSTVGLTSAVKISPDLPLDKACLVGCGVHTGWGSAVNMAQPKPGHTVIIMGIGGIGAFAVQGARHAGATNVIAVDPLAFKQEAAQDLGATHACSNMDEALALAKDLTEGQGADSAVITVGVLKQEHVAEAFAAIRKGGTVVVTALGDITEIGIPVALGELTLWQKRLQGSMFGGVAPIFDTKKMLDMYTAGQLKLDEVITTTYRLDEVNQGYQDMLDGKNVRGVIVYD